MTLTIVIDCRERALIEAMRRIGAPNLEVRQLALGDMLLEWSGEAMLLVERKSVSDLLASIRDGRYGEQSFRLQRADGLPAPHNIVYLLEGSTLRLCAAEKQRCLSAMASCHFFKGFGVWHAENVQDTAEWLAATANKLARELAAGTARPFYRARRPPQGQEEGGGGQGQQQEEEHEEHEEHDEEGEGYCSVVKRVKKENLTAANIGSVVLCQVPGFSAAGATAVMNSVDQSLLALLHRLGEREGRDALRQLVVGSKRLGDAAVRRLCGFFRPDVDVAADAPVKRKRADAVPRKRAAAVPRKRADDADAVPRKRAARAKKTSAATSSAQEKEP